MMDLTTQQTLPKGFEALIDLGCACLSDVHCTSDGFSALTKSIAQLLEARGIDSLPNDKGEEMPCPLFFDDWYLFAISHSSEKTYGLFKMREQEFDKPLGGDGDAPGVTVSFIAFDHTLLLQCMADPTFACRRALSREIDRVVAQRRQAHHPRLKAYFSQISAQAPYLIARLYTAFIASTADCGRLAVPEAYRALYRSKGTKHRLTQFIEDNNTAAGTVVCDHSFLYFRDSANLTAAEACAILATHTANTSFHSFAAEVRFHALFLTPLAKIPIPFLWHSAYDSAIRADLSIEDTEFQGPTPYYRESSAMVQKQKRAHPEYA